ncbi:Hypothetical protein A7982_06138 [Minicystis rosea]|nr:Hypothetical protein A7982_06138 [Minicystis rosea]
MLATPQVATRLDRARRIAMKRARAEIRRASARALEPRSVWPAALGAAIPDRARARRSLGVLTLDICPLTLSRRGTRERLFAGGHIVALDLLRPSALALIRVHRTSRQERDGEQQREGRQNLFHVHYLVVCETAGAVSLFGSSPPTETRLACTVESNSVRRRQ